MTTILLLEQARDVYKTLQWDDFMAGGHVGFVMFVTSAALAEHDVNLVPRFSLLRGGEDVKHRHAKRA